MVPATALLPVRAVVVLVCVLFGISALLERAGSLLWMGPAAICALLARWLQFHSHHWSAVYVEIALALLSLSSVFKARGVLVYASSLLVAFAAILREWRLFGQGV